jgi:hypothetical protein
MSNSKYSKNKQDELEDKYVSGKISQKKFFKEMSELTNFYNKEKNLYHLLSEAGKRRKKSAAKKF